jgi:thiamine biosynthesis lipoprotein
MGTEVVVSGTTPVELAAIEALFKRSERTFSRFRADSELNRVNASEHPFVAVSTLFAQGLSAALIAAARTQGLVDPTLGGAIEAIGYDRDFGELRDDERPAGDARPGSWRSLRLLGSLVFRLPGTTLDLNGVVKAMAVDDALDLIEGPGFVSAGGDVAVRGEATVGLPDGSSLALRHGGLATSGTTKRRWRRGRAVQHHLLDPRSGRPAESRWQEVTVAGPTCVHADVAAKAAFLLSDDGPDWLDARGLPGLFWGADEVVANESWRTAMAPGAVAA